MKLLQFRIRAHTVVTDTHWITVKGGVNILASEDSKAVQAVFELLQTIQPPSSSHLQPLIENTRKTVSQHGHTKRVLAQKKTAAFAIFSADSTLVKNLAMIDEALYELDRIEVGRRIDRSRWMNFVELSSSTRWSEIDQQLRQLLNDLTRPYPPELLQPLKEMIALRKGTDRLHRGLDKALINQLTALSTALDPAQKEIYAILLHATQRSQRFIRAKKEIYPQIPFFIHLTDQRDQKNHLPLTLLTELLNNQSMPLSASLLKKVNQLIKSMFSATPSPAKVATQGETISLTANFSSMPHLIQSLAALHQILFGHLPIFLIDGLQSSPKNIAKILSTLELLRGGRSILAVNNSQLTTCRQQMKQLSITSDHNWQR